MKGSLSFTNSFKDALLNLRAALAALRSQDRPRGPSELRSKSRWIRRLERFNICVDYESGHYFYELKNVGRVYIRTPLDVIDYKSLVYLADDLYYKHYEAQDDDTILDFGSGNGVEALHFLRQNKVKKYLTIDIIPSMSEVTALNLHAFRPVWEHSSLNVARDAQPVLFPIISETYSGSLQTSEGTTPEVTVETVDWERFCQRYALDRIDFIKINIEGAELLLLQSITDYSKVRSLFVSCHDFLANEPSKDYYRTYASCKKILEEKGYTITTFASDDAMVANCLYAVRADS